MRLIAWLLRLVAIVVAGALLITAVVVGAGPRLWRIANAHDQMPVDLPEFQSLSQRSYVYDVVGNVIAVFERENSQPITLSQVPPPVLNAFLAVEDEQFYLHHGVNLRGFARALLSNFSSDAPRQGASTISQQVVKNEFLAGLPARRSLQGLAGALRHDAREEDEQGRRSSSATSTPCSSGTTPMACRLPPRCTSARTSSELTMIQGAFLAGLVRSPSGYDPIRHSERARARFRQVTERLADVGLLAPRGRLVAGLDRGACPSTCSPFRPTPPSRRTTPRRSRTTCSSGNLPGRRAAAGQPVVPRWTARSTRRSTPTCRRSPSKRTRCCPTDQRRASTHAIVTLDTKTGAIRAMVGGSGFQPRDQRDQHGAWSPARPGRASRSSSSPPRLQAGVQADDVIDGTSPCALPTPATRTYPFVITMRCRSRLGTLEKMTWLSINCAFARLSQIVGLHRVVDTMYRMAAVAVPLPRSAEAERTPIQPYASFATGANEMAPLDMASGAQTIANQGLHHEPYYVEQIDRADGTRLYTHDDAGTRCSIPASR